MSRTRRGCNNKKMLEKLCYTFWPNVEEGSLYIVNEKDEIVFHLDLCFDLSDGRNKEKVLKDICEAYNGRKCIS